MKKLVNSPITNMIYWATVNEQKDMITGNKEDVTDNAIQAVLNHLMQMDGFDNKGFAGYVYNKKNNNGTLTICAMDDRYLAVSKKVFDELKEYKSMYEGLCK